MSEALLQVKNLSISFYQAEQLVPTVIDIGFDLERGKTLALLGESGSGKSVTALALMGLLPGNAVVTNGEIILESRDLRKYSQAMLTNVRGKRIGMIFQEPMTALNPVLTIGQQINEVLLRHERISRLQAQHKTLDLLSAVGIPEPEQRYSEYPHQLSGGMKQRVMIAMAIAAKPDVLIADEPTTALDVTIQAQILSLLKRLQQEKQMALLLITHDLAVAAQVADEIAVMQQGQLVEKASKEQFYQHAEHPYSQKLLTLARGRAPEPNQPRDLTVLSVKNLEVHFPIKKGILKRTVAKVRAVDGIELEIKAGETLALVGESGCGKTTIGKAILHLIKASRGEMVLLDDDISVQIKRLTKQQRANLQVVMQDPFSSMNPRMLVKDIIAEGLLSLSDRFDEHTIGPRIRQLLLQVGLQEDMMHRYPHEFSGGQRQRIAIARALAVNPKLIICDEPTSALDVSVQAQILDLLKSLQSKLGISYLFISHDISAVAYLADRVAVMYLGRLVEEGDVKQILQNPQHPYTKALLNAVPSIDHQKKLQDVVMGEQPSPVNPPLGCHFHPRCQQCMDVCRNKYPTNIKLTDNHTVKCHLFN